MTARRIVAISAGLSQPSSTRLLADRLAESTRASLAGQGVEAEVQVVELRDVAHDIINAMLTATETDALERARSEFAAKREEMEKRRSI